MMSDVHYKNIPIINIRTSIFMM